MEERLQVSPTSASLWGDFSLFWFIGELQRGTHSHAHTHMHFQPDSELVAGRILHK